MKKTNLISVSLVLVVALLTGVSLILPRGSAFATNFLKGSSAADSKEIVLAVEGYWQTALAGDKNKLSEYVMDTPRSFLDTCQDEEKIEAEIKSQMKSSGSSVPVGYGHGLSSNYIWDNRDNLLWLTEKIQKEQYKLYRVTEDKREGREAILTIVYGVKETSSRAANLLVYKESEKWKVFMFTSFWKQENYNNYFAERSKCGK